MVSHGRGPSGIVPTLAGYGRPAKRPRAPRLHRPASSRPTSGWLRLRRYRGLEQLGGNSHSLHATKRAPPCVEATPNPLKGQARPERASSGGLQPQRQMSLFHCHMATTRTLLGRSAKTVGLRRLRGQGVLKAGPGVARDQVTGVRSPALAVRAARSGVPSASGCRQWSPNRAATVPRPPGTVSTPGRR